MNEQERLLVCDLNFAEALREYTRHAGGRVLDEDGIVLMSAAHPHFVANNLFVLEPRLKAAEIMRRATDYFGPLGHSYAINIPERLSATLGDELEQVGAVPVVRSPGMILDRRLPSPPESAGVSWRVVEDEAGHWDFVGVAVEAWSTYGVPGDGVKVLFESLPSVCRPYLRTVVAYREREPVAAAQVILSHGIAGIYWVSTTSRARRRGLGELVTAVAGNLGFDLGAAFVTLQASPMGDPIYRRMGYVEVARYAMLLGPAGSASQL